MEIGIDSFASAMLNNTIEHNITPVKAIEELLERIKHADNVGLDVFGIGEHHRAEFLDSSPAIILSAAASQTKNIRLTSAVTVLSASDPVKVFQDFATLDLISKGRAEIIAGRGSSVDAFPLFGFDLKDYDELFKEKLHLLLQIRSNEFVNWKGQFRPALHNQPIYPRPLQEKMPIWLGVGGTPSSFERAGLLGLPLMIAIIGGETRRFRTLVDIYRKAWLQAGHQEQNMKIGLHSLGYVSTSKQAAIDEHYPGFETIMNKIGVERGWAPMTLKNYISQTGENGAYLIGGAEEVAEKIARHSQSLGGINRVTFQMDNAALPQEKLLQSIDLIGKIKSYLT